MTTTGAETVTRTTTGGIPGAQRVDHVALTVPSLDAALDFAVRVLGGEVAYRLPPLSRDDGWMRDHLDVHPRARAEIALVRLGPTTNLELFEYRAPDHNPVPPRRYDVGHQLLGLAVDDVYAAAAALTDLTGGTAGIGPVVVAPPDSPDAGTRTARVIGPWGVPVELREAARAESGRFVPAGPWSNSDDGTPAATPVPGLRGVDHIGYTVADLDAALAVFVDVLGGELLRRASTRFGRRVTGHATLRMGPTDNVELWCYGTPGARVDPPRNSDVGGRHLAFHVTDVDAAAAYLAGHDGFVMLGEPETVGDGPIAGDRWVYLRSPIGLHVEVVRMPDGSLPYELTSTGRRRAAGDLRWWDR